MDGDTATLKEICEWLGIVGGSTFSLFRLLIALGKKEKDTTTFSATSDGDSTIIQVQNLHLHLPDGTPQQVRDLIADPVIVAKALDVLKPATLPGYKEVGFYRGFDSEPEFKATTEEVEAALSIPPAAFSPQVAEVLEESDETPVLFKTRVFVKTQRNEGVGVWELKWGGSAKSVSMDHTDWLRRFQAGEVPHSLPLYLDVEMEMITSNTNPDAPARYRLTKVVDVVPNDQPEQGNIFDDEPA